MPCCRKFRKELPSGPTIIGWRWLLPLRILVLVSLLLHLGIFVLVVKEKTALLVMLAAIHVAIALSILRQCARSADYHRNLKRGL